MLNIYTWAMIRFSNCGGLSRMDAPCFTNMISNFLFYHVQVLVSALLISLMLEINITNCVAKCCINTVKPVLSGHSKIDKTKILMTNGSLMKVESIAECSHWRILQYFWSALSDNLSWKPILVFFLRGRLRQVLLYDIFAIPLHVVGGTVFHHHNL